jgi:parallel beta-helix repeat protein
MRLRTPRLRPFRPTRVGKLSLTLAVLVLLGGGLLLRHASKADNLAPPYVTPYDTIPDFAANPTATAVTSGTWSNPATWGGSVPGTADIVDIPAGIAVTVADQSAQAQVVGIRSGGSLVFDPSVPTRLSVGTLEEEQGGLLQVGTSTAPVTASAEIRITAVPINPTTDPEQYGTGVIAMGTVRMFGRSMQSSFVQLAAEAHAGDTTLSVATSAADWQPGDSVVLPDTRQTLPADGQLPSQLETVAITSVSSNGKTLTLAAPLKYDHLGAHDLDGNLVALPHVADLTRTILVDSADPTGERGHTLFTRFADVDIEYAHFDNLGRTTDAPLDDTTFNADGSVAHYGTNQIARYAVHLHHLVGPTAGRGPGIQNVQFKVIGNAVTNSQRWGIDLHDADFGEVEGNVVYNTQGAGIVTEDGSEIGNTISGNMVVGTVGTNPRTTAYSRGNPAEDLDFGFEGTGIWLKSVGNTVTGNVVADSKNTGISTWAVTTADLPLYAGADKSVAGQGQTDALNTDLIEGGTISSVEDLDNNTIYGGTMIGFQLNVSGEITIANTLVWHTTHEAVEDNAWSWPPTWKNLTIYLDPFNDTFCGATAQQAIGCDFNSPVGDLGYYGFLGGNLVNPHIEGASIGAEVGQQDGYANYGDRWVDGGYLRNLLNLEITGHGDYVSQQMQNVIRNVHFVAPPGLPLASVSMYTSNMYADAPPSNYNLQLWQKRTTYLINYQGIVGNDYELYFGLQNPTALVPDWTEDGHYPDRVAAGCGTICNNIPYITDVPNLTNAQGWAKYPYANFGKVAGCTQQLPEILGKVGDTTSWYPQFNEAYACPFSTTTISGTVTDASGNPIAGATVNLTGAQTWYDLKTYTFYKTVYPIGGGPYVPSGSEIDIPGNYPNPTTTFVPDLTTTTDAQGHYSVQARVSLGDSFGLTFLKPGYTDSHQYQHTVTGDLLVNAQLAPTGGNGLLGTYRNSSQAVVLQRTDPQINFDWKDEPVDLAGKVNLSQGGTSVIWTGSVQAPVSGPYYFYMSNMSMNIVVNGMLHTFNVGTTAIAPRLPVALTAGQRYPITLSLPSYATSVTAGGETPYFQYLLWSAPTLPLEAVPQADLYSPTVTAPVAGHTCLILSTSGSGSLATSGSSLTAKRSGITIFHAVGLSSDQYGLLNVPLPVGTMLDSGSYDLYLSVPGYLNRILSQPQTGTEPAQLTTECYVFSPSRQPLVAGSFDGSGHADLASLVTAIRAYDGGTDTGSTLAASAFGHRPILADLVSEIRLYDSTAGQGDF